MRGDERVVGGQCQLSVSVPVMEGRSLELGQTIEDDNDDEDDHSLEQDVTSLRPYALPRRPVMAEMANASFARTEMPKQVEA